MALPKRMGSKTTVSKVWRTRFANTGQHVLVAAYMPGKKMKMQAKENTKHKTPTMKPSPDLAKEMVPPPLHSNAMRDAP